MRTIRRNFLAPAGLQRLKNRAVFAVDRQDLAPRSAASCVTSGPAMTSVSLLARATVFPASSAAQVLRKPGAADDGGQHDVDFGRRRDLLEPLLADQHLGAFGEAVPSEVVGRPLRRWQRSSEGEIAGLVRPARSSRRWAERAMARSRPSLAAITSSALVPMLPVEPRTAMLRAGVEVEAAFITVS